MHYKRKTYFFTGAIIGAIITGMFGFIAVKSEESFGSVCFGAGCIEKVFAQNEPDTLSVPIPGPQGISEIPKENTLAKYIRAVYQFGIWFALTLAVVMTVVGGFLWMLAGGSPERVSNAKNYITSALTGVVIALLSYAMLRTVNPALVELRFPGIQPVQPLNIGYLLCYNTKDGSIFTFKADEKKQECPIFDNYIELDRREICCKCTRGGDVRGGAIFTTFSRGADILWQFDPIARCKPGSTGDSSYNRCELLFEACSAIQQ